MEATMEKVRILENDGHNTPSFHTFRDFKQAAGYVCDPDDPEDFDRALEALEDGGEFQDDNFVTWTVIDSLYETDHTNDKDEE